jgi:hypothetical protein
MLLLCSGKGLSILCLFDAFFGVFYESSRVYTSEDLKWNASGVLDFNSLLISDP